MSSTCSHQSNPCQLPFCCSPSRGVYSPSIHVITWMPGICSHWSVPFLLHSHDHRNIRSPCSHNHWSNPHPPWDRYTPFLSHSAFHVNGRGTLFLWITLMFHGVGFVLRGMRVNLTFSSFSSRLLCRPKTLVPTGFFLRLVLFPQPQVRVGFFLGLGLFP